jgi:formylglycine-generating enzyme required for sulfatase activity
MVLVPAGTVTMDLTQKRRECACYPDPGTSPERWREFLWGSPHNGTIEHHIGPVELPAFCVDEHEVTNAEFAHFLQESGYRPRDASNFLKHWSGESPAPELTDHPVVYVGLDDARAYARWAGKRLPTEPEWHRAAQGDDGRKWPWGDEFDASRCNGPSEATTPVTAHRTGRSPFGCHDMAGNVWEWTESERSDGHTRFCIIRGGSYYRAEGSIWYVEGGPQPCTSHTKFILIYPGLDRCSTIGFRCVKDVATD